jgi:predicted ATPase/DNA-binding winged helix-turn-helix (wHTH) protein
MTTGPSRQARDVISFGPFSLVVTERLLMKDGVPVELGARTLDTLIALVSRPNEIIGKRELMAEVWPDVIVEEGSLRFHIAGLRKAMGDGRDGARYITTLAGRGYCFVAPVSRSADKADGPPPHADAPVPGATFLPARLARMVGREEGVKTLSAQLAASRFVTVVGPGGVGKTTVAVAVAHEVLESFAGAALFVDFGMLSDPAMVAASVASMLGMPIRSDDPAPSLIAFLRDRHFLLILDNCEHVIEAAATLAERIFAAAPQVHILATSREALRVEGEQVHHLAPLACPPDDPGLTAAAALTFPATQLFVERATASGARLDLGDADVAIVAGLCRRLDGMALAIELAAGRVGAYGLQQTVTLLDQRLSLLWPGQRTAPARQKTLQATLDWSYGLLSELERVVLRRLAVFVGHFTMEAALAIVTSPTVDQALVFGAIDSLVAKSMVATRPVGAMMRYRLLETTRAYALDIRVDDAELADLALRHATYYRRWLDQAEAEWPTLPNAAERVYRLSGLGNVRAALEWGFGANGDVRAGVGLAAAAAPIFLAMSLLTECHRWSERAILALDDTTRAGTGEMHLQAALGMSLMFTRGSTEEARAALNRGLAIAEDRGDAFDQLRLLGPLHMFHIRVGDYRSAVRYAQRSAAVSAATQDPAAMALAHSLLGIALHLTGDLDGARAELEAAVQHGPRSHRTSQIYLGFDHHSWAGIALARTLWLQGHPDQAVDRLRRTARDAERMVHPVTLSIVLNWAISVFFWTGDLQSAEQAMGRFIAHAESQSMGPYLAVGRGYKGEMAIRRGDPEAGIAHVRACLEELHAARYELLTTAFNLSLAQGLAGTGRVAEGIALLDDTARLVEANGDHSYGPELLRVKGVLLLAMPQPMPDAAEVCFRQSLELSRRQAALAWELRTAIDLAALLAAQGRPADARALLRPMFDRFGEGWDTADLQAAAHLLATLG